MDQFKQGKADRFDVEKVLKNVKSTSEESGSPSKISRGSSLDCDEDGLLTLAGGKITDYRKMAVGAMNEIISILEDDFDLSYTLIDSEKYAVSAGELNPQAVEEDSENWLNKALKKDYLNPKRCTWPTYTD